MRNEERWDKIIHLVDQHGFLSVQELSELCDTSVITIRRDLQHLHTLSRIRRTHGGAAALPAVPHAIPGTDNGNEPNSRHYSFDRLDVLVTTDILPKLASVIQQASGRERIPVIAESLPLPGTETCVTVDNYQGGVDLGRWAAQYALEHWNGKVHAMDLTYHRPNTQARSQGFLAGLRATIPSAQMLFSVNTESRYDMAYQLTRDALSVHPDINIIFAINDISAQGANQACKDLGIAPDKLIILTFGIEGPTMIDLIMKGEWVCAGIAMFPEIVGTVCVESAIAAFNHQPLPPQLTTPHCIVTRENLPTIYEQTPAGWQLRWDKIPCELNLPVPVHADRPDKDRPLPTHLGFIYTFVDHEWYKTLARTMQAYSAGLGITLELVDYKKTVKDELNLRRLEIARRAASEVKPGDTIFIDAGPISCVFAEQLLNHKDITVITYSMPVLEILKESPAEITLISTGGAYRRSSQVFVGPTAEATLKEFRIDKLFLMVSGVSKSYGLYHTNISEVTMKQQMMIVSPEVILLADYSCFQQEALIQVAPISAVHKLITDDALPPSIRLELGTLGISVILATM
ncbi:MAG: DeoR family transcriptional regulator [Chloroflexi bacterium]|nr:DeoR family transcriptional regulator [Chloroflexota bacterium]